jgi:hypothetical protein
MSCERKSAFAQLVEATVDLARGETDEDTHIIASAGYGYGHRVVVCCLYYTEGVENLVALRIMSALTRASRSCWRRAETWLAKEGFCIGIGSQIMRTTRRRYLKDMDRRAWRSFARRVKVLIIRVFSKTWFEAASSCMVDRFEPMSTSHRYHEKYNKDFTSSLISYRDT